MAAAIAERPKGKTAQRDDPLLAIWQKASSGDQDALNELAAKVQPWTHRKATYYSNQKEPVIYRDDLVSAANAVFLDAVRSFKPSAGGFLNYYATCASRAMLSLYRDAIKRSERGIEGGDSTEGVIDKLSGPARDKEAEYNAMMAAMRRLTPTERAVLNAVSGVCMRRGAKRLTLKQLARALHINAKEAESLFENIKKKMTKYIESCKDKPGGPSITSKAIAELADRRLSQGRSWKEILDEIRITYGRQYTKDGIQSIRKRCRAAANPSVEPAC